MISEPAGATYFQRLFAVSCVIVAMLAAISGCTRYESAYEEGVADYEPVYCYRSLSEATCFNRPYHRDHRQIINFYGPAPRRYQKPSPPRPARLDPPPAVPRSAQAPQQPSVPRSIDGEPAVKPVPSLSPSVAASVFGAGDGDT